MGKTHKPLSYLIHPSLIQSDEDRALIEEKRAQGHAIVGDSMAAAEVVAFLMTFDIVLAPNAWRAFDMNSFELATLLALLPSSPALAHSSGLDAHA